MDNKIIAVAIFSLILIVVLSGCPQTKECTESDSSVTENGVEFPNYCEDNVLMVYKCGTDGMYTAALDCEYGCENAQCLAEPAEQELCEKVGEGILDYGNSSYSDECLGEATLKEYYCSSSTELASKETQCTAGCFSNPEGPDICSNICSGQTEIDILQPGTTYINSNTPDMSRSETDTCDGDKILVEAYCLDDYTVANKAIECETACVGSEQGAYCE